jgi:phosphoglucosamine mutase
VLASIVETGRRTSEVCQLFTPVPQLMRSVRFGDGRPLESSAVQRTIANGERRLGTAGRLVIRKSGTEPVIRIMAEGEDEELVAAVIDEICETILAASTGTEDPAQAAE